MENNQKKLHREEADRLKEIKGQVRGEAIIANLAYAIKKGGPEITDKITARLKELDCFLDLKNIKPNEKYPEAVSVIIVILIKEILSLKKEDIITMGGVAIKISPLMKIMGRYFISMEALIKQGPKYWDKYFDFGRLEVAEYDKNKGYIIVRLFDYQFHPIICLYRIGSLIQLAKMLTNKKDIQGRETKCLHRGDPYHEFYVSWNGHKTNN